MTVFNVHDEIGRIIQSNKVFRPEGYVDALNAHGHKFVQHEGTGPVDMSKLFVSNGAMVDRPIMPITVSATSVKAGGSDAAIFTGVPLQAKVTLSTSRMIIWSGVIGEAKFDLPIPVPCIYHVLIELWPNQPWSTDITAT